MLHQVVVNDLAVGAPLAIEQIHGPSPCRIPPVLVGGAAEAMAGGSPAPPMIYWNLSSSSIRSMLQNWPFIYWR
jgi:hypothetical protein